MPASVTSAPWLSCTTSPAASVALKVALSTRAPTVLVPAVTVPSAVVTVPEILLTTWVMVQALKGDANAGITKLKAHANHLKAQHPDAAASLLEGLEELFTINRLGVTGELARCLATTNIIESPNSQVRRVSGRVTRYRDAQMAMRWTAAGFLEAEKAFRRLRGHDQIGALIHALRPASTQLKKVA